MKEGSGISVLNEVSSFETSGTLSRSSLSPRNLLPSIAALSLITSTKGNVLFERKISNFPIKLKIQFLRLKMSTTLSSTCPASEIIHYTRYLYIYIYTSNRIILLRSFNSLIPRPTTLLPRKFSYPFLSFFLFFLYLYRKITTVENP